MSVEEPISVEEYRKFTGLSRYQIYRLIRDGVVVTTTHIKPMRIFLEATKKRQMELSLARADQALAKSEKRGTYRRGSSAEPKKGNLILVKNPESDFKARCKSLRQKKAEG